MRAKFNLHSSYYVVIFCFALILLATIIFKPQTAHAEAIYQVLQDKNPNSTGMVIQNVWKTVMALVNSLVIAVLIFIAFANILRININTYSIKKFLPALVMAIVLANFSFLICRLLVDLSNVAMGLFINGTGSTGGVASNMSNEIVTNGADKGYMRAFIFTLEDSKMVSSSGAIQWSYIGSTFFYTIFQFVAAAIMLVLALLFFIRNYVIYFLVAMAPLAFASTVLPQTKSLFNMWWSNFWKWTYMPIVSLFWIWLGAQWINNGVLTGGAKILPAAFGIVCFYLALTTPFKMGGGIMAQWGNLGKKAWGATGGKVTDYYKAKSAATWGARWQNVQNLVKDRTGIGGGLDMAQQKLADAQKRKGLIQIEAKGKYIEKAGQKRALWEIVNRSKEGSDEYAAAAALAKLVTVRRNKDGTLKMNKVLNEEGEVMLDSEGNEMFAPEYQNKKVQKLRYNSHQAIAKLEGYSKDFEAFESDMKQRVFATRDAFGGAMDPNSKQYKALDSLAKQWASSTWQATERTAEAAKVQGDVLKKLVADRQGADNVAQEYDLAVKMEKSLRKLIELQEAQGERALSENETKELEASRANLLGAGYDLDNIDETGLEVQQRRNLAESNYNTRLRELANNTPSYMQDMVTRDNSGNITGIRRMSILERSRTGQYVSGEILFPGAKGSAEQFTSRERVAGFRYGFDGIDKKDMDGYFSGNVGQINTNTSRKITEHVLASLGELGRRRDVKSDAVVPQMLQLLAERNNEIKIKAIARAANESFKAGGGKYTDASGRDIPLIDTTRDSASIASDLHQVYTGDHAVLNLDENRKLKTQRSAGFVIGALQSEFIRNRPQSAI